MAALRGIAADAAASALAPANVLQSLEPAPYPAPPPPPCPHPPPAPLQSVPASLDSRCSVYLLYWYKSTNTDAAEAASSAPRVCQQRQHRLRRNMLASSKEYLRSFEKKEKKTDSSYADAAASSAPQESLRVTFCPQASLRVAFCPQLQHRKRRPMSR